jgi:hypothetical protein
MRILFETALDHESVDPGLLFDEKTRGRKSRDNCPFILKKVRLLYKSHRLTFWVYRQEFVYTE